jgi:uncharacterized membrane protein
MPSLITKLGISRKLWITLVSVAVIAALGIAAIVVAYRNQFGSQFSQEMRDWNYFGAYFGGTVGPFLGFLSLVGILLTIGLQSSLIRETRRQVEIAESEMNQQAALLRQQTFENTFFQLIRLREDLTKSIQMPEIKKNVNSACGIVGRKAFEVIVTEYLDTEFAKYLRGDLINLLPDQWIRMSYPKFLDQKGQDFLSYLRLTIELLDLIDAYDDLPEREKLEESYSPDQSGIIWTPNHNKNSTKQRYATITLSPLTYYEIWMIALYACTGENSTHKEGLVKRYGVLRYIPEHPYHLAGNEMENEQQALYALRKMYGEIAFDTPSVHR